MKETWVWGTPNLRGLTGSWQDFCIFCLPLVQDSTPLQMYLGTHPVYVEIGPISVKSHYFVTTFPMQIREDKNGSKDENCSEKFYSRACICIRHHFS